VNAYTLQEPTAQVEYATVAPVNLLEPVAPIGPDSQTWDRVASEEFANTVTHGVGFLLSLAGAQWMITRLAALRDAWLVTGCSVYLFSLLAVYAMSTLSHAATSVKWRTLYRQLDQGFIYLLIVATYTPFSLAYLHGPAWLALLCGMWVLAIIGFTAKVFFAHRVYSVSVAAPSLLGWVTIVSVPTLLHSAPAGAFGLIISGGVCYTVGTLFLIYDARVRHFHAVWHLCVIAGSTCHFCGILNYVLAR
jgi:hemolysin III